MKNVTTPALLRHLKAGRFVVTKEYDGSHWASNTYWMVRVAPKGPIANFLADFNLPVEEMQCEVGTTLRRIVKSEGPNPEAILASASEAHPAITPIRFSSSTLLTKSAFSGRLAELWGRAEKPVGFDVEFVGFLRAMFPAIQFHHDGVDTHAASGWVRSRLEAVLMPVRIDSALPFDVEAQPSEAAA